MTLNCSWGCSPAAWVGRKTDQCGRSLVPPGGAGSGEHRLRVLNGRGKFCLTRFLICICSSSPVIFREINMRGKKKKKKKSEGEEPERTARLRENRLKYFPWGLSPGWSEGTAPRDAKPSPALQRSNVGGASLWVAHLGCTTRRDVSLLKPKAQNLLGPFRRLFPPE